MSKPTPAPWILDARGYVPKIYGRTRNGRKVLVAEVHRAQPSHSRHRSQYKNAPIIAAAPELLQIAKEMLTELQLFDGSDGIGFHTEKVIDKLCLKAREIIAKAEGKE